MKLFPLNELKRQLLFWDREDAVEPKQGIATSNSNPLPVFLKNLTSDGQSLDVYIQDQTTDSFSNYLLRDLGSVTLALPTEVDDISITLVGGHGTQVGEMICIKQDMRCFQARVLSVDTNVIGLDSPLDYDFSTSAIAHRGSFNMVVDGSTTPVIFQISPTGLQAGARVDITRLIGIIEDDSAMDSGKFGGITALTKGIVLRKKNGTYKNLFNAKSNGGIINQTFDVSYDEKAPAGVYMFRFRKVFAGQSEMGVTIRLNADDDDALQVIIQDDLSALTRFSIIAQGHIVE